MLVKPFYLITGKAAFFVRKNILPVTIDREISAFCAIVGFGKKSSLDESMTTTITLNSECINNLDLSPVQTVIENWLQQGAIASYEQQLSFDINYAREPEDPRELSEIPEVRLWFIRLDARYPWLPFLLDWKAGEFVRYTAMLVPHQFSRKEGIQYNPEALEIFLMHKIFVLTDWMQQLGIPSVSRLKSMGQMLGYDLDDLLFNLL
nr:CRR6 family NdhI maturation factor [Chroococcidiopsis sp. CCMEE 29]